MPAARQTISYLTRRFREVGLAPQSRHGQNFLIDQNLLDVLANRAEIGPNDVVLEVGTGVGALTALAAERAAAVVTVEVDPRMFQLASEELVDFANVTMLHEDALAGKNRFNPVVLAEVRRQLDAAPGRVMKLVANLPFNIATPVITNLLAGELVPRTMTVTIQKELADRMLAPPCTKDYSALSVWIQSQCRVELVRIMPPTVFWPRPKVHSAIVHIELDDELRDEIPDRAFFHRFVRSLFLYRRKFLRGVLATVFKQHFDKIQVDDILVRLDLGSTCRAEELEVGQLLQLCEAIRATIGAEGLK